MSIEVLKIDDRFMLVKDTTLISNSGLLINQNVPQR